MLRGSGRTSDTSVPGRFSGRQGIHSTGEIGALYGPGLAVSGCRDLPGGTNSLKTSTIVFGKPQIAPRLAGFGMNQPLKNHQIALIGRAIVCRIGWSR